MMNGVKGSRCAYILRSVDFYIVFGTVERQPVAMQEVYSSEAWWFFPSLQRCPCCHCFYLPSKFTCRQNTSHHRPSPLFFYFTVLLFKKRAQMEQTNGICGYCQGQRICNQCMLSIEIIATTWRLDSSSHSPNRSAETQTRTWTRSHVPNLLTIVFARRKRRKCTVHITL